jgi:hypothetical protein
MRDTRVITMKSSLSRNSGSKSFHGGEWRGRQGTERGKLAVNQTQSRDLTFFSLILSSQTI